MSDNITLPREVVEEALEALAKTPCNSVYEQDCSVCNAEEALRKALAAEQPKQEPVAWAYCPYTPPPSAHFGYVLGNHWLETAYSRVLDGEAEADVLRDCGWERVDDADALRRDAESLESLYHPATEILIEGLKKIGTEDAKRVLSAWDSGREIFDNRFLSRRDKT
jgi:hypothetical protein